MEHMMKSLTTSLLLSLATVAFCQTDNDDLYFTARDRKMELAVRPKVNTQTQESAQALSSESSPAFDGNFSGRTVNPDYNTADQADAAANYNYFNMNYPVLGVNSNLHNYNTGWNNGLYPSRFGNYSMYGYQSPWNYNRMGWGNYYDPFNNWNSFGMGMGYGNGFSPWYGSGWSIGSSFGWGNSMWSNNSFGFSNTYSFGMPMYGFGGWNNWNNFYGNSYFYGNNVDQRPRYTYGRRPSRSTNYGNDASESVRRNNVIVSGGNPRSNPGGRSESSKPATSYYQRGWRQDPAINPRPTAPVIQSGKPSNWGNSGFDRGSDHSGWRSSSPSYNSGGRSSGSGSFGGSSGGSSGGGGGRRGRN